MLPLSYRPRRLPLRFSMVTAGGREQAKDAQPGVAANGGSRRTGSLRDTAGGQSDRPAASSGSALTEEEVAVEQGSRIGCAARRVEPAAKEIRRPLLGLPQELQRVPPHVHPQRPAPPRPLFFCAGGSAGFPKALSGSEGQPPPVPKPPIAAPIAPPSCRGGFTPPSQP